MTTLYTVRCSCGFFLQTPYEHEARELRVRHGNRNAGVTNDRPHILRISAAVTRDLYQEVLAA